MRHGARPLPLVYLAAFALFIAAAALSAPGADPPVITGIEPSTAPLAGGMLLTIHGTNFGTGAVVDFEGQVVDPLIASDTVLVVNAVPTDERRPVAVAAVAAGATKSNTLWLDRTGPAIGSVTPASVPATGGIPITIVGSGFGLVDRVLAGDNRCPIVSADSSRIVCTSPPGSGSAPITLVGSNTFSPPFPFGYDDGPAVSAITPAAGRASGGTRLTVIGRNFGTAASVQVGGSPAPVVSATDTRIVCTTPAGSGTPDLAVIDGNGLSSPRGSSSTSTRRSSPP